MDNPVLTFGSLFSGIGGLDLGLERAGMRCAWQVEIDDYGRAILTNQFSDVPKYRDVRSIGRHIGDIYTCYIPVAAIDVLVGGFPCQPQSLAGKRKASKDERNLWPEFYRLIRELNPRWVVVENVLGLLSSENGAFFGGILRDLAEAGYDAEWRVLSAAQFGAPHLRERVILVAYSSGYRCGQWEDEQERQPASVGLADACAHGAPGDVAYTASRESGRREQQRLSAHVRTVCSQLVESSTSCGLEKQQCSARLYHESYAPGESLADPDFASREVGVGSQPSRGACSTAQRCSQGTAQSPVGRVFNGIPAGLDGYQWPAGPGHHQFPWEAPRVITWKMPWRAARLKGLGNAVVPALAEYVGRCIMAAEAERQGVA